MAIGKSETGKVVVTLSGVRPESVDRIRTLVLTHFVTRAAKVEVVADGKSVSLRPKEKKRAQ